MPLPTPHANSHAKRFQQARDIASNLLGAYISGLELLRPG
jgi:hypothetical protein